MSNNETPPSSGLAARPTNPPTTSTTKPNRLPAPTLFVGPPSHNASQLSISRSNTHDSTLKPSRDPLVRQPSALPRLYPDGTKPSDDPNADPSSNPSPHHHTHPHHLKKPSEKSVEAKWKEMQSTLNEVELTAQNSTHVFGEAHARALDDLRRAQVELARAWARGNDDKNLSNTAVPKTSGSSNGPAGLDIARFSAAGDDAAIRATQRRRGDTETSGVSSVSSEEGARRASIGGREGRNRLEDETAQDIRLATERRAANEAYFQKVGDSVRDVVAKLQLVAGAMRSVESESRSLWDGADGLD